MIHDYRQESRTPRIIAAIATAVIFIGVLLIVLSLYLTYTGDEPRVWPPEDTSELLLEGEYVMAGDIPEPAHNEDSPAPDAASDATPPAEDLVDDGPAGETPTPVISSKQDSPMKVREEPKPEKPGPTKEELEAREKERQQKEAAERISNRVNFGGAKAGKSTDGKSGSPNVNASSGALSGMPGTNLKGRTLASWSKPAGNATGTIVVSVRVNRQGRVVSATYSSGTGAIASVSSARRSCEQAALKSRFSVDNDAPAEQTGTSTYRFE